MSKSVSKRKTARTEEEDENEILDEQQQEHEIKSLEDSHQLKKSSIKWVLMVVGLMFAAVNGFNIYKLGFTVPKALTLASFLEATLRVLFVFSCLRIGSFLFAFSAIIYRIVIFKAFPAVMSEDLVFFPVVFNAIVQLFLSDMLSEENDIDELKKLKYKLKGA